MRRDEWYAIRHCLASVEENSKLYKPRPLQGSVAPQIPRNKWRNALSIMSLDSKGAEGSSVWSTPLHAFAQPATHIQRNVSCRSR